MKRENDEDESGEVFSKSLWSSVREQFLLHGSSFILGFAPAIAFIRRVSLLSLGKVLKFILSFLALGYFPFVALSSSVAFGLCIFCLRQTAMIENILNNVSDRIVDSLHKRLPSSAQDVEISIEELDNRIQAVIDAACAENARTKSPVRSIAGFFLNLAFLLLRGAVKKRFDRAVVRKSERGSVISVQSAMSVLQGEFVNAIILPFKNTLRTCFCFGLFLSLTLIAFPLRLVG